MKRSCIVFAGVAFASASAYSQFAVSGGTYLANNATVRSVFGKNPFAFGFGLGGSDRANRDKLGFDAVGLSLDVNRNRFSVVGGTIGFEKQFGAQNSTRTYLRAGTGLGYYSYEFTDPRLGAPATGSLRGDSFRQISTVEAGVILSRNFTISAQYLAMPKIAGVDFNGIRLQALISLGR